MESPLSLEKQCLVYIITNLDNIPPEYLALLPTRLRCQLLVNLPAVDICRLEKTEVVRGIDMCDDVWMNVDFQRCHADTLGDTCTEKFAFPKDESPLDRKELFFFGISSIVLNSLGPPKYLPRPNTPCLDNTEHLRYAEACIFAVPNILGIWAVEEVATSLHSATWVWILFSSTL